MSADPKIEMLALYRRHGLPVITVDREYQMRQGYCWQWTVRAVGPDGSVGGEAVVYASDAYLLEPIPPEEVRTLWPAGVSVPSPAAKDDGEDATPKDPRHEHEVVKYTFNRYHDDFDRRRAFEAFLDQQSQDGLTFAGMMPFPSTEPDPLSALVVLRKPAT